MTIDGTTTYLNYLICIRYKDKKYLYSFEGETCYFVKSYQTSHFINKLMKDDSLKIL